MMSKILALDTETTGLKDPEVIEVSGTYLNDDFTRSDSFSYRFKPNKPIEIASMLKHGITYEDLINEREFSFSLDEDVEYLIGHNVDFDWINIGKPEVKLIDTLSMSRKLWPNLEQHTLDYLVFYFTPKENYKALIDKFKSSLHSSNFDVKLCLFLLNNIMSSAKLNTIEEVYNFSQNSRIIDRLPFGKYKGVELITVPNDYLEWLLNELLQKNDFKDRYIIESINNELESRR